MIENDTPRSRLKQKPIFLDLSKVVATDSLLTSSSLTDLEFSQCSCYAEKIQRTKFANDFFMIANSCSTGAPRHSSNRSRSAASLDVKPVSRLSRSYSFFVGSKRSLIKSHSNFVSSPVKATPNTRRYIGFKLQLPI